MGVPTAKGPDSAAVHRCGRQGLGENARRRLHSCRPSKGGVETRAAGGPRHAHSARHFRSDRPAAYPEEIDAFVADKSPDAWEKVVDRLLASPHYGEQWGRHWLDVVRFAESDGYEYDMHRPDAWRYRDYVVQSFNDDKPYDAFVKEQLAGDEMDAANKTYLVASGFNRLGPLRKNAGNQDVASSHNEVLTEMTNIVGAAFLGVTVGCARCHDHKFDPFRQSDYYRLQAHFAQLQAARYRACQPRGAGRLEG